MNEQSPEPSNDVTFDSTVGTSFMVD